MSLFDDVTRSLEMTVNKGSAVASRKTKQVRALAKIEDLKRQRKAHVGEFGAAVFERLDRYPGLVADFAKEVDAIWSIDAQIEALQQDAGSFAQEDREEAVVNREPTPQPSPQTQPAVQSQPASGPTYACPNCGAPIDKDDAFCMQCGASIDPVLFAEKEEKPADDGRPKSQEVCPTCGAAIVAESRFCFNCGSPLDAN